MDQDGKVSAWLVRKSGPQAGARRLIRGEVTRVGRGRDNDVIIDETAIVSGHHFEIRKENGAYKILDLNSTNGTFVNGERIAEADLAPSSSIQLGAAGPEFTFVLDNSTPDDMNQTIAAGMTIDEVSQRAASVVAGTHEALLSSAVARARVARKRGIGDQTIQIMREMLDAALHRTRRKFRAVVGTLLFALFVISGYGFRK